MSTKWLKWLFTLVIGLGMVAPASVSANEEKVLKVSLGGDPPTIDPSQATDDASGAVIFNVFEGLAALDEKGEAVPAVAESWDLSEDGLTYTFHLRSEAKWSNGDAVTAGDFEYAWKRALNPETAAQYAHHLHAIEGGEAYNKGGGSADDVHVKALDDLTLEVKLVQPMPYFPSMTGSIMIFMPVHQATVSQESPWNPEVGANYVTNGPFVLSEWNHNSNFVLSKNEAYWDQASVQLDRAEFQIIEAESTANAEYQAGNLDFIGAPFNRVSLDAVDYYKDNGELQMTDLAAFYDYKVNTTDPVLSNKHLRRALALAIDRASLTENVLKGTGLVALGIVPPSIHGFEGNKQFKDADFEAAKEELTLAMEELGVKDPSEINVNISINTSEAHSAVAQFIQQGWTEHLGINVTIDNSEWQVYLEKIANLDYQIGRMGWSAEYDDANSFLNVYKYADNGSNRTGYENPDYIKLMDEIDIELDTDRRLELQKQAEAFLMEDMPVIPVYFYRNVFCVKDHVANLAPDKFGRILLKNVQLN